MSTEDFETHQGEYTSASLGSPATPHRGEPKTGGTNPELDEGTFEQASASPSGDPDTTMEESSTPAHTMPSLRVRIVQIIFLIIAVGITLLLARWQLDRYHSSTGTLQNLGYFFQWPVIGALLVYAYRKYLQYEKELAEGDLSPAAEERKYERAKASKGKAANRRIKEIPEDFFPDQSRPTQRPKLKDD